MSRPLAAICAAVAVTLLAAASVVWLWPGLSLAVSMALPAAERWVTPLAGEPRREEIRIRPGLVADLYRPPALRGAILLVHGLSRAGRRHPELERVARLLARRDVLVLVPHFTGLAAFQMSGQELAEVAVAIDHLRGLHGNVGVAGFSFGAGPALLAAAGVPGLRVVGSFGGYADLGNVVTFVTTGVHRFEGRTWRDRQEEYNRWKLLALLTGFVADAADQARLERIAARRLANPGDDTRDLQAGLGARGQGIMALVLNRDASRVPALLAAVPHLDGVLARFSPLAQVRRLTGRMLIVHGMGDDSIPFTESLRLAAAADHRLVVLGSFHHTGPRPLWEGLGGRLRDGAGLVRVADDLVSQR